MTLTILFTGHRNCFVDEDDLIEVMNKYEGALWIHGGSKGFDTQVNSFAKIYNLNLKVFKPDYKRYFKCPKYAPLARDKEMVDLADLVIACYDGREVGGTYFTVNYAREKNKPIQILKPKVIF